MYLKADQKSEL